ncbi:MAG: BrnT family toxin [Methylocella sp.]
MKWTWDREKNRTNKRKHGLSFETAKLVFDDRLARTPSGRRSLANRWSGGNCGAFRCSYLAGAGAGIGGGDRPRHQRAPTARERRAYEEGEF